MKIISACLCGINCNFKGRSHPVLAAIRLVREGNAIPVCPEQLGGLPTPRIPAEQKSDKVFTKDGRDVTHNFVKGAKEGLKIAKLAGCKEAVLKSKSPSCGFGKIYDGNFTGTLIEGNGVFAGMLSKNGIKIFTENDI